MFFFEIVGGPENQATKLKKIIEENGLNSSISVHGRLSRKSTVEIIQKSYFGILINSKDNSHSIISLHHLNILNIYMEI